MSWFNGFVVYFLIWWLTLFAILPIGARPAPEGDPAGGWRGVPERPRLLRKALLTTIVAAVIFAGVHALIVSDWLSFRGGWFALPDN
jgi:predicted secreted protein